MYLIRLLATFLILSITVPVIASQSLTKSEKEQIPIAIKRIYKAIEKKDNKTIVEYLKPTNKNIIIDQHMIALAIATKQPFILGLFVDYFKNANQTISSKTFSWIDYRSSQAIPMVKILTENPDTLSLKQNKYPVHLQKPFLEQNIKAFEALLFLPNTNIQKVNKYNENFLHWALLQIPKSLNMELLDAFLARVIPLLKKKDGFDIDLRNRLGQAAVELAILNQAPLTLSALLENEANIHYFNSKGQTLLEIAASNSDVVSFHKLLEHGLNPYIKNQNNETVVITLLRGESVFYGNEKFDYNNHETTNILLKMLKDFEKNLTDNVENSSTTQTKECPDAFKIPL